MVCARGAYEPSDHSFEVCVHGVIAKHGEEVPRRWTVLDRNQMQDTSHKAPSHKHQPQGTSRKAPGQGTRRKTPDARHQAQGTRRKTSGEYSAGVLDVLRVFWVFWRCSG